MSDARISRPALLTRGARALLVLAVVTPATARAGGADPAAAREQLKQGYALKKAGNCAGAMPLFVESERLDPQAKTLLNLAECEDKLGHLVDADVHLAEARDRARTEARKDLETYAQQQLAILEPRVPRLTIILSSGAPVSTQVFRDDVMLGAASLGVPLPTNPGSHTLVARAEGFGERRVAVTLKEKEKKTVTLSPTDASVSNGASPAASSGSDALPVATSPAASSQGADHIPAFVAFGVGAVGVIAGSIFGLRAMSQWSDAKSQCDPRCASNSQAVTTRDDAQSSATISTIGFAVGAAGIATGAVLWILESQAAAPAPASARAFWLSPGVDPKGASMSLGGRF